MIDTVDFLRNLTQLINDRMGDVDTAHFRDGWPDGVPHTIILDLADGQQFTLVSVDVTR